LNLFDYLLLAIVGLSMVLSLWRGFVREIISLTGLIAAFFAAGRASGMVADYMDDWIKSTTVANIIAFVLIFIIVMVLVSMIGALIRKLVDMSDLSAADRTLGVFFGLARGLLLIGLFFLIYTSYAGADRPWMKKSMLTPYAIEMGNLLGRAIPADYPFSRRKGSPAMDRKALKSIIRESMP